MNRRPGFRLADARPYHGPNPPRLIVVDEPEAPPVQRPRPRARAAVRKTPADSSRAWFIFCVVIVAVLAVVTFELMTIPFYVELFDR